MNSKARKITDQYQAVKIGDDAARNKFRLVLFDGRAPFGARYLELKENVTMKKLLATTIRRETRRPYEATGVISLNPRWRLQTFAAELITAGLMAAQISLTLT